MPGFTERVGRAVVAPRAAARALCQGGRGGLVDALWLLGVRILAGEAQTLTQGFWRARTGGPGVMLDALLRAVGVALPDVGLILLGSVVMGLLLGERERALRPGLLLDLSAQAWIPWCFVHVMAALALTLLQHQPGEGLRTAIQAAALLGFVVGALRAWQEAGLAATKALSSAAMAAKSA